MQYLRAIERALISIASKMKTIDNVDVAPRKTVCRKMIAALFLTFFMYVGSVCFAVLIYYFNFSTFFMYMVKYFAHLLYYFNFYISITIFKLRRLHLNAIYSAFCEFG